MDIRKSILVKKQGDNIHFVKHADIPSYGHSHSHEESWVSARIKGTKGKEKTGYIKRKYDPKKYEGLIGESITQTIAIKNTALLGVHSLSFLDAKGIEQDSVLIGGQRIPADSVVEKLESVGFGLDMVEELGGYLAQNGACNVLIEFGENFQQGFGYVPKAVYVMDNGDFRLPEQDRRLINRRSFDSHLYYPDWGGFASAKRRPKTIEVVDWDKVPQDSKKALAHRYPVYTPVKEGNRGTLNMGDEYNRVQSYHKAICATTKNPYGEPLWWSRGYGRMLELAKHLNTVSLVSAKEGFSANVIIYHYVDKTKDEYKDAYNSVYDDTQEAQLKRQRAKNALDAELRDLANSAMGAVNTNNAILCPFHDLEAFDGKKIVIESININRDTKHFDSERKQVRNSELSVNRAIDPAILGYGQKSMFAQGGEAQKNALKWYFATTVRKNLEKIEQGIIAVLLDEFKITTSAGGKLYTRINPNPVISQMLGINEANEEAEKTEETQGEA